MFYLVTPHTHYFEVDNDELRKPLVERGCLAFDDEAAMYEEVMFQNGLELEEVEGSTYSIKGNVMFDDRGWGYPIDEDEDGKPINIVDYLVEFQL